MTPTDTRRVSPSRHGQPWTAEDFADVMAACREGLDLDGVALRIGRSPTGLRSQLRRMLPVDERHISPDLVVPRLRQLNHDGDYDWLAAMAQRERPQWVIEQEAREAARADAVENARVVGLGALPDDQLAAVALAALHSPVPLPPELVQVLSSEITARGLTPEIVARAYRHLDDAASSLLQVRFPYRDADEHPSHFNDGPGYPGYWDDDPRYGPAGPGA